jgi:hypothetical protein
MVVITPFAIPQRFFALLEMRKSVDQTPPHRPAGEGCKYSPEALTDSF